MIWLWAVAAAGVARPAVVVGRSPAAADPGEHSSLSGVYVNESLEARQALRTVHELASSSRWAEAARGYDRLIAEHGDDLVRVDASRLVSVADYVNDQLARWPAEAVEVYRGLFNEIAAGKWRELSARQSRQGRSGTVESPYQIGDAGYGTGGADLVIADRWWLTDAGGDAADDAAQRLLEAGRFDAAGRQFDRLSRFHPRFRGSADVAVRAAVAFTLAGRNDRAADAAGRARAVGGLVRWFGQELPVETVLSEVAPSTTRPVRKDADWPMFGGDASRNRPGPAGELPGELFWRCDLGPSVEKQQVAGEGSVPLTDAEPALIAQPVVRGDRVYVQDTSRVWAIGLNSGRVEWVYDSGVGGESGDRHEQRLARETRGYLAPVVADGWMFAILAGRGPDPFGLSPVRAGAVLVGIEARDGTERWRVSAATPGGDEARDSDDSCRFEGSPLLHEQSLYVVVRQGRGPAVEDCYLACFDPQTGQRLWQRHLAGGGTGIVPGQPDAQEPPCRTGSGPAAAGDSIYVQTHLGALACVSASTGRVRWLTLASREDRQGDDPIGRPADRRGRSPSALHPVVVAGGHDSGPVCVMTTPSACGGLLIYDAEDGHLVRRVPTAVPGGGTAVLGAAGDVVYAVGEQVVALDLATGRVAWRADVGGPPGDRLDGAPFLTAGELLIPTRSGLVWMSLDGARRGRFDWPGTTVERKAGAWTGNILAVDNLVLVAGRGHLCCYASLNGSLARIEQRIAGQPDDPETHLDMARYALMRPALFERGLLAVDAALRCATSRAGSTGPPYGHLHAEQARRRAFDIIVDAAEYLTVARIRAGSPGDTDLVSGLLSRAEATARDGERQVRYRLVFADLYRRLGRGADAVHLYQQILDDRSLREWRSREQGRSIRAGTVAEGGIGEMIARLGRQHYEPYDSAASAMLQAGVAGADRELLKEAIARYPNARSAGAAYVALAQIERRGSAPGGAPIAAARLLRTALARHERSAAGGDGTSKPADSVLLDEPEVVRSIAGCYFDANDAASGLAWLARGARDYPSARFGIDGRSETFASLRRRRLAAGLTLERRRPMIAPPLKLTLHLGFDGPTVLLRPRFEPSGADVSAAGIAVVYHGGKLEAFTPGTGKRRWPAPLPVAAAPVWLAAVDDVFVFATRHQVLAVDRDTGRTRWTLGRHPRGADSPAVDPEVFSGLSGHVLAETLMVNVFQDGRASAVRIADGEIVWERRLTHRFSGPAAANDEYLVYASIDQDRTRFVVLDVATGRDVRAFGFEPARQVYWMAMSPERTLVAAGGNWAACYDPDTSARLWQVSSVQGNRAATLQMGLSRLYLSPGPREISAVSLTTGCELWRTPAIEDPGQIILETWLDGSDLYAVATRGVGAFDPASGAERWWTDLPDDVSIDTPALTDRFIVLVGSPQPRGAPADEDRRIAACFIDRRTGRAAAPAGRTCLDWGPCANVQDVGVYDHAVWIRDGATVVGWTAAGRQTAPASASVR